MSEERDREEPWEKDTEAYVKDLKSTKFKWLGHESLRSDGYCACCYDEENGVKRYLQDVGKLLWEQDGDTKPRKGDPVLLCSVCDGPALEHHRTNS